MTIKSRHISVVQIIVEGDIYNVHVERYPEGYGGYVVWQGQFFCSLPIKDRETDLLDVAEARITELMYA